MNKIRAHLLLFLIASTLVACSGEAPSGENPNAIDTIADTHVEAGPDLVTEHTELPASDLRIFSQTWTGDLDAMEEHRVVRLLTVFGEGRYYLEDGRAKGVVAELANDLENFLNKRLEKRHVKIHVLVIPVARDRLIPDLLAGRGDIASAGLSITSEREAQVAFTLPLTKPRPEILITGPGAKQLKSIQDLSGQAVFLRASSSYWDSIEELNDRLRAKSMDPVTIEPVSELLEDEDLADLINRDLLPWTVVDSYKVEMWKGAFENVTARPDLVVHEGRRIAWAFRKESPLLEAALNEFLKTHREGTLLGNMLRNRYVREFDWAAHALDAQDYRRFEEVVHIFRKYGEQYGIDHLIVAAQGYQESRLDQSVRSAAGAIGIMQLLPTTAADPSVGIPDIENAENNIHAGVKYLQYLRSRYFTDPEINEVNQTLLALGAYNAGPRRMINLRAKAEARGYNPNVWFDNVEVIAAEDIGRETVEYVANIYKYYLAYRLSAENALRRQGALQAVGEKLENSAGE